MNDTPLVSIIINCYNSEKYLKDTIDSVINQTYKNWELIFWDNQSTDHSADIVKSYQDDRIRYFFADEHTSLGEGRNLALNKALGEYVSFLDADDFYYPDKITKTVSAFSSDKVGLVYTNGYTLYQSTNCVEPFYSSSFIEQGRLFNRWLKHYDVKIPSVMFKASLAKSRGIFFDPRFSMVEEYDFFLQLSQISEVGFVRDKLCVFRVYSTSLTSKKLGYWAVEYKLLADKIHSIDCQADTSYLLSRSSVWAYKSELILKNKINRYYLDKFKFKDKKVFLIYILSFFGVKLNKKLYKLRSGR